MCHYHTSAVVLSALQNLQEIVWRIFKVSFQYFSIHLHSHSAPQRLAEIAAGSGEIRERSHETQPGFWKRKDIQLLLYTITLYHFDHFWDIKYWKQLRKHLA